MNIILNRPYHNISDNSVLILTKKIEGDPMRPGVYYVTDDGSMIAEESIVEKYKYMDPNDVEGSMAILNKLSNVDGLESDELFADPRDAAKNTQTKTKESLNRVNEQFTRTVEMEQKMGTPSKPEPKPKCSKTSLNLIEGFKTYQNFSKFELNLELPNLEFVRMFMENMQFPDDLVDDFKTYFFEKNIKAIKDEFFNYFGSMLFDNDDHINEIENVISPVRTSNEERMKQFTDELDSKLIITSEIPFEDDSQLETTED